MPKKTNHQSAAEGTTGMPIPDRFEHSEARFRALFDTAAVGIGLMSLDRKILDANPAMCQMLGIPREEFLGQTPAIATYPEDYVQSTQDFYDLASGKKDYYWSERRYVRRNGEIFWAHVTLSTVRGKDGLPQYIVGIVVDIDKQKRAQEGLEESEKRFRAVFENAGVGMALIGLDRRALAVNESLVKMSGYSHEEILAMNGDILSYPPDREIGLEPYRELAAGSKDSFQVERRYLHKSGYPYWVRQTISAVRDHDGQLKYLIAMIEDINQQKLDQEHLQESEVRFHAMFENVSVGMAMMGLDRRVLSVNQAAERILGYSTAELLNLDAANLSLPEDREVGADLFRELISGKRNGFQMEKRYVRKNGSSFWARVTYSLVRSLDSKPLYLVGLIEDINEQKTAAELLAAREKEYLKTLEQRVEERTHELMEANLKLVNEVEQRQTAEEALAAKAVEGAIAAERTRLAHDLHDAVTQTLFSASMIADVLPALWDINEAEARNSSEELRQLTRGALAEMRTLLLELRPAALTQARFSDLIRQLSEAVTGRSRLPVSLEFHGEADLPPDVKVALYRIAQESLNNIVKYSRATRVDINASIDCCSVHMEIRDNGFGFDVKTVKPTSLGMRIMRERADAIHARLEITSKPGSGTLVVVEWNESN